jgi:hypothetical protein
VRGKDAASFGLDHADMVNGHATSYRAMGSVSSNQAPPGRPAPGPRDLAGFEPRHGLPHAADQRVCTERRTAELLAPTHR